MTTNNKITKRIEKEICKKSPSGLRILRAYLGIEQQEFAYLIELSKSSLCKMEGGYRNITDKTWNKAIQIIKEEMEEYEK